MKVRVRPRNSTIYPWKVEALHPEQDKWHEISIHNGHWLANLKARILSKRNVEVYMSQKDRNEDFLNALSEGK